MKLSEIMSFLVIALSHPKMFSVCHFMRLQSIQVCKTLSTSLTIVSFFQGIIMHPEAKPLVFGVCYFMRL